MKKPDRVSVIHVFWPTDPDPANGYGKLGRAFDLQRRERNAISVREEQLDPRSAGLAIDADQ